MPAEPHLPIAAALTHEAIRLEAAFGHGHDILMPAATIIVYPTAS